ncbi:GntR family transcriptional regulator [Neptunomonas japonica]|uniref:GntR family transcriptional regulator, phosphonate transport system regulatory protein n=1 Tax=Neptunomonas japonica JAMM 1380 TaxID=1441457 RepID=A0A7R6PGN7_9GAMM|nr:GntR family transcriptional regulator [Neptunomonas japonica]BBB29288.1 GntR family transcriptional regulator, phosphonate transport system regulatory protein [Neptunomonas japonica JAMM 1380]
MAVYLKIATQLRDEIRDQYESGDLLPSEKQLADRFNVNRHTLRRAVDELVQDGLIKRFQGLGNQVVRTPIDYSLHSNSCFTYNLSKIGLSLETEVLGYSEEALSPKVIERLNLAPTTAVILKTRRYIDDKPASLIKHHLFNVDLDTLEKYTSGSLHQFLRNHYQFDAERGNTKLSARMPTFDECQQLGIGRGVPVMEIHSQYVLKDNQQLMEYSISITRSDIFEYSVEP